MHVCHVTIVHQALDPRIFHKECRSIADAGHQVSLIASGDHDRVVDGVQIWALPRKACHPLWRACVETKRFYQKALEVDADVYHLHDPELLPWGVRLRRNGKKVIYDAHEDLPRLIMGKIWIPAVLRYPTARIAEAYENRAARIVDLVVTATDHIRDRFRAAGAEALTIHNYPRLEEIAGQTPFSQKENAICYIGNISKLRGMFELMKAIEQVDCQLHLGGPDQRDSVRSEMKQMSGWSKVIDHGFLNRQQVSQTLGLCKVGIVALHPRIAYVDALPVKLLEYMAAGLPVIASNFPKWKAIVEDNQCGICVDPLNPDEIAAAIGQLLSDDDQSEAMGRRGRELVESQLNWSIEEQRLLDVYQQRTSDLPPQTGSVVIA